MRNSKPWSEEELQVLKKFYFKTSKEKLLEMLPNRTWNAIVARASKLGLKRYRIYRELKLTEIEKAWLAAAIDCDGTISAAFHKDCQCYRPIIAIYNTNLELLEKVRKLILESTIDWRKRSLRYKKTFRLRISNKGVVLNLLTQIYPYLIVKKKQAKLLLECLNNPSLWSLNYPKIKELNRR